MIPRQVARVTVLGGFALSLLNFRGPLLRALVESGHEVIASAPDVSDDVRLALQALGTTCREVPMQRAGLSPSGDLHTLFSLLQLFREVRPDTLLCYTIKPVIWGLLAARLARVPRRVAMITGLGYAFMDGGGWRQRVILRVVCFLYRRALAGAHVVMFQNPDDRTEFEKRGLLPKSAEVVMINGSGVDTRHYAAAPLPQAPVFLLMARLLSDKGIREYVGAAKQLRVRYPSAHFLLAGPLDKNPAALSEVELQQWQREGAIEYLGSLRDVRPALARCRIYVLPSYREGTPRSVLEAMSSGRPIITTDAPGCRETVKEGSNGFLVPVRDTDALARAMERFILEPELAGRMGQESRRIAEEKYDVNKVNAVIMRAMGC